MTTATFEIEDHAFAVDVDSLDAAAGFTVRSVPRPYPVRFSVAADPFAEVRAVLADNRRNLLLVDDQVHRLYAPDLDWPAERVFRAAATEAFKSLDGVEGVLEFLARNGLTKGEKLVVVGGGIIQDVGAFASAMFKRGVPWVFLPTTLLSQCDSCIGAKTGINYRGAKNQLGLFSAPSEVVIDPRFLSTLAEEDRLSGMGEILKLHVTGGAALVDRMQRLSPVDLGDVDALRPLVLSALAVKRAVVEYDEYELDLRRSMNYGHTIGHALEAISEHAIPHGTAVTIGMMVLNEWSSRRGMLARSECDALADLARPFVSAAVRTTVGSLALDELEAHLRKDKKTSGGTATLVVLARIGKMRFVKVALDRDFAREIASILEDLF